MNANESVHRERRVAGVELELDGAARRLPPRARQRLSLVGRHDPSLDDRRYSAIGRATSTGVAAATPSAAPPARHDRARDRIAKHRRRGVLAVRHRIGRDIARGRREPRVESNASRVRIAVTRSAHEVDFVAAMSDGAVNAALARARPSAAVTAIQDSGSRVRPRGKVVAAESVYAERPDNFGADAEIGDRQRREEVVRHERRRRRNRPAPSSGRALPTTLLPPSGRFESSMSFVTEAGSRGRNERHAARQRISWLAKSSSA